MKRLVDYFDRGLLCYPARVCLEDERSSLTYNDVAPMTHAVAHDLMAAGYGKQNVMSILSPNCAEVLIVLLGAMRVGVRWCNINIRNTADSNIGLLKRNKCDLLYYHSSMKDMAEKALAEVPSLTRLVCLDDEDSGHETLAQILAANLPKGPVPYVSFDDSDILMQIHTGGTTGEPKLTEQSNRMITTMMIAFATVFRFEEPPVNLAVAPLTHAAGPIAIAHMGFGGSNIILSKADPETIMQAIQVHRVTTLFLPPTVTYAILAHPRLDEFDLSSLKYWVSTAAPIAPEKLAEAARRFGPIMLNIYGQTESGFPITALLPHEVLDAATNPDRAHLLKSCGRPTFFSQMGIVDDDGNELGVGEIGEICSRGENLVSGFFDEPGAINTIRTKDGWQRTGDVGYYDSEGYFYISDRKRDLIISGGFNIFPIEIESTLQTHVAVQDCVVVGIPDEKWGESVKAVVLLKPNAIVTEAELVVYCREALGSMKAPKSIEFWDDLPRSPVGKVLRRVVRDQFWQGHDSKVN